MKIKLVNHYDKIKELYEQGLSMKEISLAIPCGESGLPQFLKRHGLWKNYKPETKNYDYFENIDTKQKAYFLGYIAADGCVQHFHSSSCGLSITIHVQDIAILEKLKSELESELTIKILNTKTNLCRFQIASKKIYDDLVSKNIVPRKSLILDDFIQFIPEELRIYAIVGYIDGDGSVFKNKYGNYVSMRGTEKVLTSFKKHLNIMHRPLQFSKTYILGISNLNLAEIKSAYLDKELVCLERKRVKIHGYSEN